MLVRDCPPMLARLPPATRILPSDCTANEVMAVYGALGSNESARPVLGSSRAMDRRDCPPMLMKSPPARILPSGCKATHRTPPLAFGLNESTRPVAASKRAMRPRDCPPMLVK